MREDKDFIGYRLVPFCIGLAICLILSIIGGIFYGLIALVFAIGAYGAAYGNSAGVIASFIMGIPLILAASILSIAFWILTTWLLGRWAQEKCRNYKIKTDARREAEDKIRAQAMKQAEQKTREEAAWEAEWEAMKRKKVKAETASGQQDKQSDAHE